MAQSLLQEKRFFCREWAFTKISHCLENRPNSKTCGALIMGGPGSGKTAMCCEMVWPTASHGKQRSLSKRILAYHFCQAHDVDTVSVANFIMSVVQQLSKSELIANYAAKLNEPEVQAALSFSECERNPDEAFKKGVLFPLLEIEPPKQTVMLLVDSIDESYLQNSDKTVNSKTIAELLSNHHQLFPQWLLLICSARKQSKTVTRLFTGFRKISLDDLRKSHVVRDGQQYILSRLEHEHHLRQHLSRETAEMLNQLHIKSNGCFLYLEKVLDGVAENFIMLREVREIPGTLNGLYLWLCQRLFVRKQFARIQPILNVILAARKPLREDDLFVCAWTRNTNVTREDFHKKMKLLSKLLIDGKNGTKILFHHSFAEWLLDVKHCTQKYLCHATDGHGMLAMNYTLRAPHLLADDVQEFALHLSKTTVQQPLQNFHLPLWLIQSGAAVEESLLNVLPKEQKVIKLLIDAGAKLAMDSEGGSTTACSTTAEPSPEDELLQITENLAQLDANQRTLLHNGAYEGNLQLVEILILRGLDVEAIDKSGQTAMNLSARQGHAEVVRALLCSGANPDHADSDGWTPLRSAAWGGHTEVVNVLVEKGAQVDLADSDQRTALRAAAWGGHDEIVLKLLQHGASVNKVDNEGRTALIAAAYMGHAEIVEHLLQHKAEINHEDADGRTALSVAALCVPASEGHAGVVNILLEQDAEVDHRDKDGMTPLLVAAFEGHREVCELLLEYDADVDHTDNNNRTPLLAAASMGHASVVNLLLFWGAAVDTIDSEGRTVLCIASAQGNPEVVRQLLDRGLDEMHRDNAGWTPLHYAAFEGHREVCEQLLEAGARANEVDNDGKHALIMASQEGHVAVVATLLENGAMIDHRSHDGKTPLRVAALEGHKDVVHLLICHGADINYADADGRSTLYVLALENRVAMATFLLENCTEVESKDFEGRTPLHVATWQGHIEMVELLLNYGADVNAVDNDRRTALQSASWQGHASVVKLLLSRNATVDHTCNQGATALCIAAQEGHEDVVRLLLEYNADPNHADQFGRTALRVAHKAGHISVVKLLEEYCTINGTGTKSYHRHQGSTSTTSIASGSTAETKPCSAILCPPGLISPTESPESTFDKRRSFVSNQSSSKSSSNLTSSTNKSQHSQRGNNIDVHGPSTVMTFTQQLQQCTRNRNRPISRVLSPLSEPQSPINSPPQSPLSEIQSSRLSPIQVTSPLGPTYEADYFASITVPLLSSPRIPGSVEMTPLTMSHSSFQSNDSQRKISMGIQETHLQNFGSRSPDSKLRRNGIVTNPNFKGSNNLPINSMKNHHGNSNINQSCSQHSYKQSIKAGYETPMQPSGLPLKKETPL